MLASMDRYFQGLSECEGCKMRRSFPIKIVDIYRKMATNTFYQYPSSLSMMTPIVNFSPSMHQVLNSSPSILRVLGVVLR